MNEDFARHLDTASRTAPAEGLRVAQGDRTVHGPSDDTRARRRRTQRLVLLSLSVVTLFSLAGMIITRAMEIASL
ncbi:hypothetical protein [Salipiger mangrovisoli]|uniref:Uncharacterized protein n=1 Tax=Salipiger mangrovisoli TaxID=2865933 RepID=A0ABR9WWJ6_9RHOB|nr:hypothetical protein [Salipiger mangrovisoli]MBE9635632.1 hypothetical protein [Salipiger mangrovisoli]